MVLRTVCENRTLQKIGVGGVILHFRLGPMSWEATEPQLRLFAAQVAPEFRTEMSSHPTDCLGMKETDSSGQGGTGDSASSALGVSLTAVSRTNCQRLGATSMRHFAATSSYHGARLRQISRALIMDGSCQT